MYAVCDIRCIIPSGIASAADDQRQQQQQPRQHYHPSIKKIIFSFMNDFVSVFIHIHFFLFPSSTGFLSQRKYSDR